jgi:hypothetical protein
MPELSTFLQRFMLCINGTPEFYKYFFRKPLPKSNFKYVRNCLEHVSPFLS